MSKNLNCILFIFMTFTVSCSTQLSQYFEEDEQTAKRNEQLMESFEVEDDVLDRFKSKKEIKESIVSKEKTTIPEEKKKTEKIVKKETIKNKVKQEVKKTQKVKRVETQVTKVTETLPKKESEKDPYPEDYPKAYKKVDITSASYWSEFKPVIFPGEEVFMDINYMGVSTGKIAISTEGKTEVGNEEVFHLKAQVKTARYYRYLYELDDNIDSFVTTKKFIPVKYSLIQRESSQDIDDLQLFDLEKLKTYTFYKRITDNKKKKKKSVKFIPQYFQDPLSVIFFLRGLPMEKGRQFDVPIINKGKLLHLRVEVLGLEEIETKLGKKEAYKMKASSTYSGDTLESGDMTFWFSNDDRRIFLKFKAKIKIGSISGDIEKYRH